MKTKSRAGKARTKNGPSKRVGSGRLVGRFLALKSKQWWKGGFTEYRVFVGDGANRRYLESLRSSAEIVAVEMREVKAPNAADHAQPKAVACGRLLGGRFTKSTNKNKKHNVLK